ncbi:hypothetical protein POM88_034562 [Heracleum sosnowskyi]|uniref:Glycine-rich protein n=1 Tax=Heracleum sosnowskyi TaxID=360622 RepID=A0AAD8HLR6_9APIA|nr:hypothetical protein POM88_034562 [Heracleum sosnowskyi]
MNVTLFLLPLVISKGKSTSVESSGTAAAYKWESKQSSSGSKAAWNTFGEKETGGDGAFVVDEFSGKTGHFARKCSLGGNINGGCSGGHGGGNMGKALCTRMP